MVPLLSSFSNIDLLTVGVASAGMLLIGFAVFFSDAKSATNRVLLFLAVSASLWGIANYFSYQPSESPLLQLWLLRIVMFLGVFSSVATYLLAYTFPERAIPDSKFFMRAVVPISFIVALLTLTPLVLERVATLNEYGRVTAIDNGLAIVSFAALILFLNVSAIWKLSVKVARATRESKTAIGLVLAGLIVMLALIIVFNLILPAFFQVTDYIQFGALFMFPFVALTGYAILKHGLFDVKVAATAALVFLLAVASLVDVIISTGTFQTALRAGVFLLVLIFGIGLVRSVFREVEQREQIEILADNLRRANEKLKELDKLKSQFLSIASHDMRAPLTAIRNFVSLLLDGTYGKLPPAAEEGMQQVFDRATSMAKSIETYLNVSRIEQGRMQYDFGEADLVKLVSDTVQLFKTAADKKQITLSFKAPSDLKPIRIKADVPKLEEVFNNLVDNAIKYTPNGSITVTVENLGKLARVEFKDTGGGMDRETIDNKLFKLFSTAEDSLKQNAQSTGVGLYITKAHIVAHGGTIRAESEGKGKGSSFIIELPIL